jgi:curved DNA-binding protein CbpA
VDFAKQNLAEAYMVLKDPEKRSRYDNGTLNDDVYFDGEDAFEQFGGNPHTFHDFFGFLFARMFARRGTQGAGANGNQAFFWDPDEEDAEFDSEEEEYISEEEEEDDGEYYDADPSWRHVRFFCSSYRCRPQAFAIHFCLPI